MAAYSATALPEDSKKTPVVLCKVGFRCPAIDTLDQADGFSWRLYAASFCVNDRLNCMGHRVRQNSNVGTKNEIRAAGLAEGMTNPRIPAVTGVEDECAGYRKRIL